MEGEGGMARQSGALALLPPPLDPQQAHAPPSTIKWDDDEHLTFKEISKIAQGYSWDLDDSGTNFCGTLVTSQTPFLTYIPPSALSLLLNPALADKKYHQSPKQKSALVKLSSKKHSLMAAPGTRGRPAKRPLAKISSAPPPKAPGVIEEDAPYEPVERRKKRAAPAEPPRVEPTPPPASVESSAEAPRRARAKLFVDIRVPLAIRVHHLGLTAHSDKSWSSAASIRIICVAPEGSPERERANRLKKALGKIPGINARIPKEGSVASAMAVTHVVVPGLSVPSLFTTVAISKGAWRVPYEWAEQTLELSRAAGKCVLANEIDDAFSHLAFRSKYYFFSGKTFLNHLTDEKKRDEIHVVLDHAGAVSVAEKNQKAQIVVVDDDDLPTERPKDPTYWIYSDFLCTFDSAALSGRSGDFRDWNN